MIQFKGNLVVHWTKQIDAQGGIKTITQTNKNLQIELLVLLTIKNLQQKEITYRSIATVSSEFVAIIWQKHVRTVNLRKQEAKVQNKSKIKAFY